MSNPYVGDIDIVNIEGWEFHLVRDLSNGADEDLKAWDKKQGGDGSMAHYNKMVELAIQKLVSPDGKESKPTFADVRRMKQSWLVQLGQEVMRLWYPLDYQALLQAMEETAAETPSPSGLPSTGTEASATSAPTG